MSCDCCETEGWVSEELLFASINDEISFRCCPVCANGLHRNPDEVEKLYNKLVLNE